MNGLNQQLNLNQTGKASLIQCVWMQAGVVDYKLCDRDYDCERCPFDEALHSGSSQSISSGHDCSINVLGCRLEPTLFYHPEHTWVRVEEGGMARVGLDDFGQRILGRAYSLSFPAAGTVNQTKAECLRLTHQSGTSGLAAPIAGKVKEINSQLKQRPALLNRDPYGAGWLMLIEPFDLKACLNPLMYGARVRNWLEKEIEKLRFLIGNLLAGEPATMTDGGLLTSEFMSELTPGQRIQVIDSFFPLSFNEEAKSNNAIKFPNGR